MKMFDKKAWRKDEKAEELLFLLTKDKGQSITVIYYLTQIT